VTEGKGKGDVVNTEVVSKCGFLFVVTGASGVGKDAVVERLLAHEKLAHIKPVG